MNRDGLLDKIRALLSKTTGNGCTKHEALAALAKARAMMDAYEVTEEDLKLSAAETAILRKEPPGSRDQHGIKSGLAVAIGRFCDCKVWRGTDGLEFCGLQSDVQFSMWLLEALTSFVQAELVKHLMGSIARRGDRRRIINGFTIGCTQQISERLNKLCNQSEAAAASNSRALVLVKSTAVADKLKELGIHLGKGRRSSRRVDLGSFAAGEAAGNRASFGRPVGRGGTHLQNRTIGTTTATHA
jgi:hypothetical protein